ncbi:glycerophosphodiester phosphodiesterase [Nocardioides daeguensis]|nr:glycerophosphodiester phosphodiesterase family protein [Nocardioides daeguensis]MBV6729210.1 glycerophosphodiester phosphodiesterase family protein [Nocardioides daeguensis]MCR1774777.1 glycerophosphodiester phosphodiesterase family protein [Nocardioides daeguensis]
MSRWWYIGVVGAVVVLVGVVWAVPGSAMPTARTGGSYEIVAHRGGAHGSGHAENSYGALRYAASRGVDRVEVDLRPTADRRIVMLHDDSLARTTSCHGRASTRTLSWIHAHCRLRDGSQVPALPDYVALASRLGVPLMLELKESPRWGRGAYDRVAETIAAVGYEDRVRFMELNSQYPRHGRLLRAMAARLPRVDRVLIVSPARPVPSPGTTRARGGTGVSVDVKDMTAGLVDRYHAAGMRVFGRSSTFEDWGDFDKALRAGADGHVTDRFVSSVRWARNR